MTGNRPQGKSWVERWYRVMLLGYPAQYRERHGGELLGTLLESDPSRRLPSLRESASLLDAGMLTRLRSRLAKAPAWADGLQLGLFLLALTRAGSLMGGLLTAHQRPQLPILLATLPVVVAVLLGRMRIAAVAAAVAATLTTYQALLVPGHGTAYVAGVFSSRLVEVPSAMNFWLSVGPSQFWVIALGSAVLAMHGRGRGPLPRRSWWWLTLPLLEAAFTSYGWTLLPTLGPPNHQAPTVPGSFVVLSMLPLIVTIGFLLLALRATLATGDARWTIATGVYLIPVGVYAAALVSAQPSAIVTLDYQLPIVLLAATVAMVLLRRAPRRAAN
ncbi:hypothetical protein ABIA33_006347 [Streptacidiphilus sp. MAP12-16]|uniref:hypothetical protein n=1 Tax=Streptacidiphilus sp. MAP12-16 TaxID=3156300 RepID=UPI00351826DA